MTCSAHTIAAQSRSPHIASALPSPPALHRRHQHYPSTSVARPRHRSPAAAPQRSATSWLQLNGCQSMLTSYSYNSLSADIFALRMGAETDLWCLRPSAIPPHIRPGYPPRNTVSLASDKGGRWGAMWADKANASFFGDPRCVDKYNLLLLLCSLFLQRLQLCCTVTDLLLVWYLNRGFCTVIVRLASNSSIVSVRCGDTNNYSSTCSNFSGDTRDPIRLMSGDLETRVGPYDHVYGTKSAAQLIKATRNQNRQ